MMASLAIILIAQVDPHAFVRFGEPPQEVRPAPGSCFEIGLRWVSLGGDFDDGVRWSEAFDDGGGLSLGFAYYPKSGNALEIGPYGRITFDAFGGRELEGSDPVVGDFVVTLDDLFMQRFMVGITGRTAIDALYVEARAGIGLAFYGEVLGDYEDAFVFDSGVSIIDASAEFAFEGEIRGGCRIGPELDLSLAFSYEFNGAPEVGVDVDESSHRYDDQKNFGLTVMLGFRF